MKAKPWGRPEWIWNRIAEIDDLTVETDYASSRILRYSMETWGPASAA
jgi:hypothetical protein